MNEKIRKILGRIARGIAQPEVFFAKLKGVKQTYAFYCITVEELLGKKPKTVIDVGANRGDYIDAALWKFPNAKIYAFEPIKRLFDEIKNKKNVTAYNIGIWNRDTIKEFNLNDTVTGASSFLEASKTHYDNFKIAGEISKKQIEVRRLDGLGLKIIRPCLLKIDVEGAEEKVLGGAKDILDDVDLVQIEYLFGEGGYKGCMKIENIIKVLSKHGFVGFIQKQVSYSERFKPLFCDLIFFKDRP